MNAELGPRIIRPVPDSLQRLCVRIGGLNPYGEPNYRLVWGWSRLHWSYGEWTDHDEHGDVTRTVKELRRVPKYPRRSRYFLEAWRPALSYGTPFQWYMDTKADDGQEGLGPYPERGDYESVFTFEDTAGRPVEPTATIVERVIQENVRRRAVRPKGDILAELDYQKRKADEKTEDIFADALRGVGTPKVSMGGMEVPTSGN